MGSAHRTAAAASSGNAAGLASTAENDTAAADVECAMDTSSFREVPHKLKDRFLHYAQRDPASGEFVLTLDGFVRCMLLLPATAATASAPAPFSAVDDDDVANGEQQRWTSPSSSPWLQRLPPAVRRRFLHFFHCVDIDGTNAIDYAEFVVLFTFLSTRRQTFERAFNVFDLDDNGRLSEREFCRLLNTIIVDPAVQVKYTPTGSHWAEEGGEGAPRSTSSRAGESRRSERQRQRHKHELSFEVSSHLMRPLLFGPLPLHIGAPPGSTYYTDVSATTSGRRRPPLQITAAGASLDVPSPHSGRYTTAAETGIVISAAREAPAGAPSSASWWGDVARKVQQAWAPLLSFASSSTASSTSASASLSHTSSARMAELQQMAEQDSLLETVSYPTFLYRMDYLRWELRAIEFGLCDPSNKGFISVEDCRALLRRDRRAITESTNTASTETRAATADTTEMQSTNGAVRCAPVTWQEYQKLFDVIKESNTILPALQLMLDALPPVPAEVLRGGAIPDDELKPATLAVQAVVHQTVLRYNRSVEHQSTANEVEPELNNETNASSDGPERADTDDEGTARVVSDGAAAQVRYNKEKFGLSADPAHSPEEKQKRARRLQATLVRPSALTWKQFSQVLAAVGTVPRLSAKEEALFRTLLDDDGSDSLSPHEFAHLCTMKETFFAEQLPRFDEPKRNTVQQFFFCMQQLE
ncbi:hypothetical protein ABB37_00090 [Leptomonas pyrrhocoris]|uniref:EF-hand domain-containing protein n=1 Tax=Leptomonas pyrrhocoris TaxID=157538 RepID=A0A0N0VHM0_LEPPY|nr:hypothetical protein ABB37_00090 [Leptomonas pyrrhocoris]KPA85721.1 hypothetical protein ABB37_00090 [Leptomonas pyrrhocoris]|eukprot:XP_015664160.1 hypothetical protein ABB37_00090 [Leptomonas pyrrhocoris]